MHIIIINRPIKQFDVLIIGQIREMPISVDDMKREAQASWRWARCPRLYCGGTAALGVTRFSI